MDENRVEQRLFEIVEPSVANDLWEEDESSGTAHFQARSTAAGADFKDLAIRHLIDAGASIRAVHCAVSGIPVDAIVEGSNARRMLVLARGTPDNTATAGLRRRETVLMVGFLATHLAIDQKLPVLIVTSHLPARSSAPGRYLSRLGPYVADVIATTGDLRGFQRLRDLLHAQSPYVDTSAPWRAPESSSVQMTLNSGDGAATSEPSS
jgi:hypothetical protein